MRQKLLCQGVIGMALIAGLAAVPGVVAAEGWRPWELSASLAESYDSNRDSTKSGTIGLLESIIAAKAALKTNLEQTDFSVFYAPSVCYRDNPRWNQERSNLYQDAGLDVEHRFTPRLRVDGKDTFTWTDEPAIMSQDFTIRENITDRQNVAAIGGNYELLPGRAVVGLSADHLIKRYLDDKDYAANGDETAIGGGFNARYLMRSGINVLADVSAMQTDLSTTNSFSQDISRDSTIVYSSVGLEKLFAMWRVRGRLGMDYAKYDNAVVSSGSNPGVDVDISYLATASSALNLAIQYRTLRADVSPYTVQQRTSVNLSADHNFSERLKCSFYGIYASGAYKADTVALYNGVPVVAGRLNGSDTLTAFGADAGYSVTRNVKIDVGAGYQDWNADKFLRTSHDRITGKVAVTASF